jgi:hypothetical protein
VDILLVVLSVLASVLVSIALRDLYNCLPLIAKRIIKWRLKQIPEKQREQMTQEIINDIDGTPSMLHKICIALFLGYRESREEEVPDICDLDANVTKLVKDSKEERKPE